MKNIIKCALPVSLLICLFTVWKLNKNETVVLASAAELQAKSCQQEQPQAKMERERITFILGEDEGSTNPYYAEATKYYQQQGALKTGALVTHFRSLLEVRNYLQNHAPKNKLPWGKIELIVHSNEWSGMGVNVTPEGERVTTATLLSAIAEGQLKQLPDAILDAQSELLIQGCALGRNTELLEAMSIAFGGDDQERPVTRSSRYFIFYETVAGESRRLMADFWYAFFKTGYRPGDIKISRQLTKNNPDAKVDWRSALARKQPRWPGDPYHYYFNIPINWTVTYEDEKEVPRLETEAQQEAWLNEQTELLNALKSYGIPINKFRWKFKKTLYEFEDGAKEPAIVAEGKTSILCVLQTFTEPMKDENDFAAPILPSEFDERFYTAVFPATKKNQIQ